MKNLPQLHQTCFAFIALLASIVSSNAYLVGPPVSLDKMTEMSDLVIKGKALSNFKTNIASFESIPGYAPFATTFQVISVLKREQATNTIIFLHYGRTDGEFEMYKPQHYEFLPGHSYILFAKKTDVANVFIQLWKNHTAKEDEGVFRCVDDAPLQASTVKDACWQNLLQMRASTNADELVYSLHQLDQMSIGQSELSFGGTSDFPRTNVLELLRPLLSMTVREDDRVLRTAIEIAGAQNPDMRGEPEHWLATVGKGHLPGLATYDSNLDNPSGRFLWRELTVIANSRALPEVRSSAIAAMGRTHIPELTPSLQRWAKDPEPLVRRAAIVLLADVPGESAWCLIQAASADSANEVRQGAALAIGFGQLVPLLPQLEKLLKDNSPSVRQAAIKALLSFPVAAAEKLLRQNLGDPEYHSLFVNALAIADPASRLADLQSVIINNSEPTNWWGGAMPSGDSWNILFKYIQSRQASKLQSGQFDASLDALEKLQWYSSSEPRDLYALYLQKGLIVRAKAFREKCCRTFTYDIDYFFKMVDCSPNTYTRD